MTYGNIFHLGNNPPRPGSDLLSDVMAAAFSTQTRYYISPLDLAIVQDCGIAVGIPTGPPIVTTNPATLIASFSARLNGSLNPHGLTTTFHFEYGLTTSYGLTTPPQNRSGNTPQNVSANISDLMANRVYHFRIVASNADGTSFGGDRTFTTLTATGPPVVTTNRQPT